MLLVPVHRAYALRPNLAHLGTTRAEAEAEPAAPASAPKEDDKAAKRQRVAVRPWDSGCMALCVGMLTALF